MKKYQTIFEGSVLLFLGGAIVYSSFYLIGDFGDLVLSPGLFPFILGSLLIMLSLIQIVKEKQNIKNLVKPIANEVVGRKNENKKKFFLVGLSFIYIFLMSIFGFCLATFFYVVTTMFVLGEKRIWFLLVASLIVSVGIYIMFDKGLQVYLP